MIRLFTPHDLRLGVAFPADDGQSRYLTAVMRQGVGDEILAFNGRDGEWRCVIAQTGKRFVALEPKGLERAQSSGPELDLIIAVVKRGPLEFAVEKATELGVARICLALTERTNADRVRIERLRAIAVEAAEQTGRLDVPQVREPVKLSAMLDGWGERRLLFCDEAGDAQPALEALAGAALGPWAILVGPEGGFSAGERDRLRALPFALPATLGPRILRADTAAISALTLWQAAVGDWREEALSAP